MISEIEDIEIKKELAKEHFNNYEKYYDEKNYPKASEFLWGTLNNIFYAIGLTYNIKLSNYEHIKNFIPTLANEYSYPEITDQYKAAETLHANFYHDFMDEDLFEYNKEKVVSLIFRLYDILSDRIEKTKEIA